VSRETLRIADFHRSSTPAAWSFHPMRAHLPRLAAFLLLGAIVPAGRAQETKTLRGQEREAATPDKKGVFLVEPYLQLGDAPALATSESVHVLWQADDQEAGEGWSVEYRNGDEPSWRRADKPETRRIAVGGIAPHRVFQASLSGLKRGEKVEYRVRRWNDVVFTAKAQARKGPDQPYRFVAFGDCGANTAGQKSVAYQTYLAHPDFVFIAGDIVYSRGRVSEYREKYWPIYNAEQASPATGAPLLRSTLFVAAPGNHDIGSPDLKAFPDGLAYFYYWSQPMNGPLLKAGGENTLKLEGPEKDQKAFLDAAGPAFPRMANFSFDYGNSHWVVLDSNPYADWTDTELRTWVENDLAAARDATWRFVAFHHPGFNSSRKHFGEQRMRRMAETFERGGVDVVFSGHVHNYQRTYPLRFVPESGGEAKKKGQSKGEVGGRWTLDKVFDGNERTKPKGVISLVTGGGGASLYDPEQQDDAASWQEFTHKFLSKMHSLTIVDVEGSTLKFRQVSDSGTEVDRFTLTK